MLKNIKTSGTSIELFTGRIEWAGWVCLTRSSESRHITGAVRVRVRVAQSCLAIMYCTGIYIQVHVFELRAR